MLSKDLLGEFQHIVKKEYEREKVMILPFAVELSQQGLKVPPYEMAGTGKDVLWVHGAM